MVRGCTTMRLHKILSSVTKLFSKNSGLLRDNLSTICNQKGRVGVASKMIMLKHKVCLF